MSDLDKVVLYADCQNKKCNARTPTFKLRKLEVTISEFNKNYEYDKFTKFYCLKCYNILMSAFGRSNNNNNDTKESSEIKEHFDKLVAQQKEAEQKAKEGPRKIVKPLYDFSRIGSKNGLNTSAKEILQVVKTLQALKTEVRSRDVFPRVKASYNNFMAMVTTLADHGYLNKTLNKDSRSKYTYRLTKKGISALDTPEKPKVRSTGFAELTEDPFKLDSKQESYATKKGLYNA